MDGGVDVEEPLSRGTGLKIVAVYLWRLVSQESEARWSHQHRCDCDYALQLFVVHRFAFLSAEANSFHTNLGLITTTTYSFAMHLVTNSSSIL